MRNHTFTRATLLLTLLATALLPAQAQVLTGYSFTSRPPYRNSVPSPASILGYEPGAKNTTFRDQERALLAIAAAAKDRVQVFEIGKSVEGRPLRLLAITAPENLARLEALRQQNLKFGDPRLFANEMEAQTALKTAPALLWINHCIHGNETASFEAFLWTFYTLAASDSAQVKETLKNAIILLNPAFNPDGHERFTVYYNSLALGIPEGFAFEHEEPWGVSGRFNHYRYDMNRDKIAQSQPETQQEIAAYLRWMPQLYVDQHGQPETYFFPPNPEAIHPLVDTQRLNKWTERFGRANAQAFDKNGWQYVTREDFDLFYPGYLDSWATLSGAIGMTYETDGGRTLSRRRRDGTVSTLLDATAHHVETALATLFAAAKQREELVSDFYAYRKSALVPKPSKPRRVVLLPNSDPGRAAELATLLLRSGIEVSEAKAPFTSTKATPYLRTSAKVGEAKTFPKGALIVDFAQPQGALARAFLEADPEFLPAFVKEQLEKRQRNDKKNENEPKEGYHFYDITAWSLPYAFDIEAYATEDAPKIEIRPLRLDAKSRAQLTTEEGGITGDKKPIAYLIPYNQEASAILALRLNSEGFRLAALTKPLRIAGKAWERGTFVLHVSRNPSNLRERLEKNAKALGATAFGIATGYSDEGAGLGSDSVTTLPKLSIAVLAGDSVSVAGFGSVWHTLEKVGGVPFTPIALSELGNIETSRFNVLVFPDGYDYMAKLGKEGVAKLKEWIRKGGALIGLEGGGQWFFEKDAGLSSVASVGSEEEKPKEGATPDKSKTPIALPGALFRAHLDNTHFLGFGYAQNEIAVPLMGETFLKPSKTGSNVITFEKGKTRLSGFVWENNTEELLGGTAYLIDEPLGRGHAILFLNDPTFRSLWVGLRRMFWNSLLFAPSATPLTP